MLCEPAAHLGVLRMTGFLGHLLPGLLLTGPAEQKHVFRSYHLRHSTVYRSLMLHQRAIKLRACLFWAWASEWAGRGEPSPQTGTSELSIFICEQKCSGTSCRCQASTFI